MSTEYLSLNDSRPELIGGLTSFASEQPTIKPPIKRVSLNENKFMNMTVSQIFDKIINILPNMYNDYYTKSLETKLKIKMSQDEDITESDIFRETIRSFIFENENIIFLGILVLIITFFLYIIN